MFTPDPIAVGIPTAGEPILIDMSASITTNGMTARLRSQGRRFPGAWAMTADGEASDDPNVLFAEPPGTLLPTGGLDHGHKGYNLALAIEALSQGLSGHGRADPPTGWGASVYVQVMDPAAFGGAADFVRQTSFIAEACRSNPPAPGAQAVRLPGQQGLARKRQALSEGVALHPGIMEQLGSWAGKLAVAAPAARSLERPPSRLRTCRREADERSFARAARSRCSAPPPSSRSRACGSAIRCCPRWRRSSASARARPR